LRYLMKIMIRVIREMTWMLVRLKFKHHLDSVAFPSFGIKFLKCYIFICYLVNINWKSQFQNVQFDFTPFPVLKPTPSERP